jgi:hypothetical protein
MRTNIAKEVLDRKKSLMTRKLSIAFKKKNRAEIFGEVKNLMLTEREKKMIRESN